MMILLFLDTILENHVSYQSYLRFHLIHNFSEDGPEISKSVTKIIGNVVKHI